MNNKFISDNPELLHYTHKKMHITVLGGIKLTGLDRLRVTLKIVSKENLQRVFRHNVDLYNSMQTDQLNQRVADFLEIGTDEMTQAINDLTMVLESYRSAHLEFLKPKTGSKAAYGNRT